MGQPVYYARYTVDSWIRKTDEWAMGNYSSCNANREKNSYTDALIMRSQDRETTYTKLRGTVDEVWLKYYRRSGKVNMRSKYHPNAEITWRNCARRWSNIAYDSGETLKCDRNENLLTKEMVMLWTYSSVPTVESLYWESIAHWGLFRLYKTIAIGHSIFGNFDPLDHFDDI